MKKPAKIILGIVLLLLAAGWGYWQWNKKHIIRNAVEGLVSKKTDSLYYLHYESSKIDAANGNASFYKVVLQSDSLQQQLRLYDTASDETIYHVEVAEVSIKGANIPSLLANDKVQATSIQLIDPVIWIIQSGKKEEKSLTQKDKRAIYEKIIGRFNSIKATEIIIKNGVVNVSRKTDPPFVKLDGIDAVIKNVAIDSAHDYDNLVSYFIKDATVKVRESKVIDLKGRSSLFFKGLEYNAGDHTIQLANFKQVSLDSNKVAFDINHAIVSGINTDSFILNKQIKAESLAIDGGMMSFSKKKGSQKNQESVEIDNNFFDEALLNKISIGKSTIVIYDRDNPKAQPFTLKNARFSASGIQNLYSGTNIRNLIGRSNWQFSADGFSLPTKDKIYKINVGSFSINKGSSSMHIDQFSIKPAMSEAAFVKSLKQQTDMYDVTVNNIELLGVDARKMITEKIFLVESATIEPIIKVSNDRTIPPFTGSKIGNYPHQLVQKIDFPIYIGKVTVKNGSIVYKERSSITAEYGTLTFKNAHGEIKNVTNMPAYISKNNMLTVNAYAQLLGAGNLQTQWKLPLDARHGEFAITGSVGSFNAGLLNGLAEPLALTHIRKGVINAVNFNMTGNDSLGKGTLTLLYDDLKVEALKKDSTEMRKKGLVSFIANLLIRDKNPSNGITRKADMDIERDKTRSFFNLVWKGIFKGAKRTALGKNDE